MAANPYSFETYIGPLSSNISVDIINHYLSYMKESGFSINAENITIVERILWETYPEGISFQAWYSFDKGNSKDTNIKKCLTYAFENIDIQSIYIVDENSQKTTE